MKHRNIKTMIGRIPLYIGLLLFAATALLPFLYMLATAMTPHAFSLPYPPILIPENFYLQNFIDAWGSNNFSAYFLNSVIISVISTLCIVFVSCITAYAFARLKFPGREIVFNLFLFSMMVPSVTNLTAQFTLMKSLNLIDSYFGLIMIYTGTGIAIYTFFLRNYFLSFPKELEEAMIIDGGNRWNIFWHLLMPLSKPAIATFGILAFSNVWDEFLLALTFINDEKMWTLPIAIKQFQGNNVSDWGLIFAASIIAILPIMAIYIILQKYLIRGGALDGTLKE